VTAEVASALWVPGGIMGDVAVTETRQTLVGRDAELSELSSLLGVRPPSLTPSATPRAVLLAGDAGVGKTRLLTELRDLAVADGWQVVAGHCLDFGDSALPYLPFSEVMGRLATDLPDVVETISGIHPALGRLQPGRRTLSGATEDAGSVDRGDLFEAMHSLLGAAAAKAPLLLVIEDAHWADQSTRDMVSFLFSRPFLDPVGIVVSYRAEDLHRRHPLRSQVAEWSRVRGVERLQLNPLSDREVRTLVRALHPDPITEADLSDIVDRAEGNAFFVEELVGTTWGGRIPEDLAEVLLVRLDRLDDSSRQVVRAMSVAGRQVSHGLLAEASGVPADALDQALRAAVESHVVVTSHDRYSFRHALLAEAIYDDLLPGERVRLHAAYAEALRDGRGRGTAAELARHALAARELPTALEASVRAGDEAMAVGGPEEAAHHFQQALELVVDPVLAERVDGSALVLKTADALVATGMPQRAAALVQKHLDAVGADEPAATRARLHAYVAHTISLYDNDLDWRHHLEAARELTPEEPTPDRARLLAIHARVLWMNGRPEAKEAAMEALALAETHNLPRVASDATTTLVGLNRKVPIAELAAALEDAARRARETGAVSSELRALYLLGRGYQDRGHLAEAADAFRRATDRATQAGTPWAPWAFDARFQQAQIAYIAGDWDRVLALTTVDGQAPPPIAEAMLSAFRSSVLSGRGLDQTSLFKRLRRFWPKDGLVAIFAVPVELAALGRAGRPAAALGVLDDMVTTLVRTWPETFQARVRLSAVGIGALVDSAAAMTTDERARFSSDVARLRADGLRVVDKQVDAGVLWGPEGKAWARRLDAESLHWRWLTGQDAPSCEELVAAWRETIALFEEFGHVPEVAQCRIRLAAVLRSSGDQAGARELADLAREAARGLGAQPMLDELRALGTSPARAESAGAETLTPRETEILNLVAAGRSNGEIGKQLFISAKTVSVHVSNILAKLGAAGRTEAAAIARRRGLLGD
jgi:DNA-binding CsgD family transcriptional regulator/tetratricopeptide (TPR) repeat protein